MKTQVAPWWRDETQASSFSIEWQTKSSLTLKKNVTIEGQKPEGEH